MKLGAGHPMGPFELADYVGLGKYELSDSVHSTVQSVQYNSISLKLKEKNMHQNKSVQGVQ